MGIDIVAKIRGFSESVSFLYAFLLAKLRFRWMSKKAIRRYQLKKARRIVRFAIKHSPYFRELYRGHDLSNVWVLPTTNKKMMMDRLSDYNTLGFHKDKIIRFCLEIEKTRDFTKRYQGVTIAMSSGTSGNKGVEILTKQEENFLRSLFLSRLPLPKGEPLNLAFILRVSAPAVTLNKFGHRLTYINQLCPLHEMRAQLEELLPNAISGPPSVLGLLAKEAIEGRFRCKPNILISYGEVLYPEVKVLLKQVFHCEVHEVYKCTEGAIAISCRCGRLHINEDVVAVELFDACGSPTPPGSPSHRMIVTDLIKQSQPIIRYELNDVIEVSKAFCPCGSSFRVIERVQGRSDDVFLARRSDTDECEWIFPDYISRAIISCSEDIAEYQAMQKSPDEVLVRIALNEKADRPKITRLVESSIERVFALYKCKKPSVNVSVETGVSNVYSGKLIRIYRNFANSRNISPSLLSSPIKQVGSSDEGDAY